MMIWLLLTLLCNLGLVDSAPAQVKVFYDAQALGIVITGLDIKPPLDDKISVYFEHGMEDNMPAVLGSLTAYKSGVLFQPKYGLSAGARYTICVKLGGTQAPKLFEIRVPTEKRTPITELVGIYPSASTLPMNQLKLYLEFSAPMRKGFAQKHIKLYRLPDNYLEEEAFLITHEELWDPDRKRLTLFFDPGRIKRGVRPNQQLGLPLVEGRRYRLQIDSSWLDAKGLPLVKGKIKEFQVLSVDRKAPDPHQWEVKAPQHASDMLVIDFHEPMDYGLLHSALQVVDQNGQQVSGSITLSVREERWHFKPNKSWIPGTYTIVIDSWLEDLAGNNLNRKFDVDLNDPNDHPKDIQVLNIPFEFRTTLTK